MNLLEEGWKMRCWVFNTLHSSFKAVDVDVLCCDVVEGAKCLIGTALSISPSRLCIFFTSDIPEHVVGDAIPLQHISRSFAIIPDREDENKNGLLDVALGLANHLELPEKEPPSWNHGIFFTPSSADAILFERTKVLCELPHFSRDLLVVVVPLDNRGCGGGGGGSYEECGCQMIVPFFWPRFSKKSRAVRFKGPFALPAALRTERNLSIKAFGLIDTPSTIGDIGEAIAIHRCVVELSGPGLPAIMPEYLFSRMMLSEAIPFSMCRSLLAKRPCSVRVYTSPTEDGTSLKREWPFRTLRCQKSLRPTGILFRVQLPETEASFATVEWFPSGMFRVTLEESHYQLRLGHMPLRLEYDLEQLARSILNVFLAQTTQSVVVLPHNCDGFNARFVDVQLNYTAFAAVTDIKRLVDDEIRRAFFVEPLPRRDARRPANNRNKVVSLIYALASVRVHSPVGPGCVRCKLIRSASNGVLCRLRLRGLSQPEGIRVMLVMAAASMIRYSIVRSLPREFEQPRSTMGLQHVDPELHYSVKNSGLSRKIWKFGDKVTGCDRPRRPVPVNLQSQRDMERYRRAPESQWLMWYRGVWYAAVDDENENGTVIRNLRKEHDNANDSVSRKKKNTPANYPKELRFFNGVVLKEITEKKYRTKGYEGEEFRYFPACIRYRGAGTLPDRCLAIMGPLFRRGLLKFKGQGADDIEKQLRDYNRRPMSSGSYIIKANKTLGSGDLGELPDGVVYDWARRVMTSSKRKAKILRKGVQRDKDRHFSSLHALLNALRVKGYDRLSPVEAEAFVRKYWKNVLVATLLKKRTDLTQLTDVPELLWREGATVTSVGVTAFNDAMCEIVSVVHDVNVVTFHYSYTSPNDVDVTFSGSRYRAWLPVLVLLKTLNGVHYEPIILQDEDDVEEDDDGSSEDDRERVAIPETEITHLFSAFYPEKHQHNVRVQKLSALFEDKTIRQIVNPLTKRQCGVIFDKHSVPVPVINGPVALSVPQIKRHLTYAVPNDVRSLVDILYYISDSRAEELQAYRPKMALKGPDDLVYALVLHDTRLICQFERGMSVRHLLDLAKSQIDIVDNLSLTSPFMGILGTPVEEGSERYLALHPGKAGVVRKAFKEILLTIFGWMLTSTTFSRINEIRLASRRRKAIRDQFVLPAVRAMAKTIPIAPHIMVEMLTAFIDHHPDCTKWEAFTETMDTTTASSENKRLVVADQIMSFDSPDDYLKWLVRQE
jgi:hypothetical protein